MIKFTENTDAAKFGPTYSKFINFPQKEILSSILIQLIQKLHFFTTCKCFLIPHDVKSGKFLSAKKNHFLSFCVNVDTILCNEYFLVFIWKLLVEKKVLFNIDHPEKGGKFFLSCV